MSRRLPGQRLFPATQAPSTSSSQPRLLQRTCGCGGGGQHAEECAECRQQRDKLQRQATDNAEASVAPPIVHEVLHTPGEPLDPATRTVMEARLGHDFSQVRVHTDARAAASALAVQAQAYTVGQDIVLGAGAPGPQQTEGRRLLAHELVHTIQQASGLAIVGAAAAEALTVSSPSDRSEREAEQVADRAFAGPTPVPETAMTTPTGTSVIHRQPLPDVPDVTLRPSPQMARLLGSGTFDGFALNSATLTSEHKTSLRGLTISLKDLLRSYPSGTVQITGHTDATGEEKINIPLGQQRADAVRQFLVDAGVVPEALITSSAGESQLRVQTDKAEPRNRRVEVQFEPESRVRLLPPLEMPDITPPGKTPEPEYEGPPEAPPWPGKPQICVINPELCKPPETPTLPPDFWKPLPPVPKGSEPKSLLDVVFDKVVDPVVKGATGWLPKGVQDKIRDLAHDAVEKGITTGLEAALKQSNLGPTEQQAILKAVEAAIKQKGKPTP
jgi:outer membrane protein OmpA-like peptidoglycan-associated protein